MKNQWDLTNIYSNDQEWEKALASLKPLIDQIPSYKGKLGDSKIFHEFMLLDIKIGEILMPVYSYAHLASDLNRKDIALTQKMQMAYITYMNYVQSSSWVTPEIISLGKEKVLKMIDEYEDLHQFRFQMETTFHNQEHILEDSQEAIISNFSNITRGSEIYSSLAVADHEDTTVKLSDGKKYKITHGNFRTLLSELKEDKDRKKVLGAIFKGYEKYKNTYASIYTNVMKSEWANAKSRGFNSVLESKLFVRNIPTSVFMSLIETTRENTAPVKKYYQLRKKYFGLKNIHTYDRFLEMSSSTRKYSYEEGKALFFASLEGMNDEFVRNQHRAVEDGYVDVYEKDGKVTGAYSSGIYGHHPYILLNYNDDLDNVFTLAHESGHSAHTLFSNEAQPYATADYAIFVAEIASTFNEHNLLDYMVANAKSKEERICLLQKAIDDILSTYYRQTLFANYEYEAFKLVEENKPVTEESLSQIMISLYKDYYDIDITKEPGKEYIWAYIPHLFNTPYYVYQYATSFSASLKIYENIKNNVPNAMENYIKMLKAGGSQYPIDIVKLAGVDLSCKEPFLAVVNRLTDLVDQLEKLINE